MPAAIPIIAALVGTVGGTVATKMLNKDGSEQTATSTTTSNQQLEEALAAMMGRQKAQDPLFQALTNLGVNLLPRSAYAKYPGRTYGEVTPNIPGGKTKTKTPPPVPTVNGEPPPYEAPDGMKWINQWGDKGEQWVLVPDTDTSPRGPGEPPADRSPEYNSTY